MKSKNYFPMFVDLSHKKIIVIGAGTIAARRIETLTSFAGDIQVIAPGISQKIYNLHQQGLVKIKQKFYEETDLVKADIVLAATADEELNREIGQYCKVNGIPVNVASDKELCDFYFPGIIEKDEVVIGITASGKNHKKAREIREKISMNLDQWIE